MASVLDEAGFATVDRPTLADWRPGRDGVAVVMDAGSNGAHEELSSFVDDHPHVPVIAVVEDLSLSEYATQIRAGAKAVLGRDEPTEALLSVLDAALAERSALPFWLARSLAARIPIGPAAGEWVTDVEAAWLRHLAAGTTVAKLAETVGYSEREMFRMLGELYARIGVQNRTEAIIWATRHGLLEEGD